MNSNQTYEKVVKQCSEKKQNTNKALAIMGYSVFFAIWLVIGIFNLDILVPLAATGVLCTIALILLSWKYLDVEYEYALWYGSFEVAKIYSKKSRKTLLSAETKELLLIAPATEEYISKKIDCIRSLCDKGYADKILLSHDALFFNGFDKVPRINEKPTNQRVLELSREILTKESVRGAPRDK